MEDYQSHEPERGLGGELCQAWNAVLSQAPSWQTCVTFIGCAAVLFFIVPIVAGAWSRPADPFAGVPISRQGRWETSLIGQSTHLPAVDLQGYPVPAHRPLLIVTISCTSCAAPDFIEATLSAANVKPVIVCSENFSGEMKRVLERKPGRFLLLSVSAGDGILPDEMVRRPPQATRIDASGVITEIPDRLENLEEFLRRQL